MEKNFFYVALGATTGNPLNPYDRFASLEHLYNINELIPYLDSKNSNDEETLKLFNNMKQQGKEKVIIWGSSKPGNYKVGDLIFFGFNNCIFYYGEIYDLFINDSLTNFLWGSKNRWKYKVIMKNLIKTYIPRNLKAFNATKLQRLDLGIDDINSGFNFEKLNYTAIFNLDPDKTGNRMSVTELLSKSANTEEKKQILRNLELYHLFTKNKFLIEVILDEEDYL